MAWTQQANEHGRRRKTAQTAPQSAFLACNQFNSAIDLVGLSPEAKCI
jgi:hypothetical protein